MSFTLKLEQAALGGVDGVTARVLRAGFSWDHRATSGGWQVLMPVAVVDTRFGYRRLHPVVDPMLVAASAAIGAGFVCFRRRR